MSEALDTGNGLEDETGVQLPHNPTTPVFLEILALAYALSSEQTLPPGFKKGFTPEQETWIQLGNYRVVLGADQRVEALDEAGYRVIQNDRIANAVLATFKNAMPPKGIPASTRALSWLRNFLGINLTAAELPIRNPEDDDLTPSTSPSIQ